MSKLKREGSKFTEEPRVFYYTVSTESGNMEGKLNFAFDVLFEHVYKNQVVIKQNHEQVKNSGIKLQQDGIFSNSAETEEQDCLTEELAGILHNLFYGEGNRNLVET